VRALTVSDALWATSMTPEGLLEAWRAQDGARIEKGQAVAEVRIEDAVHEILAPTGGRLVRSARVGDLVQPDDRIGWVADR